MNFKFLAAGVSAAVLAAGGASATVLFDYVGPTPELSSPGTAVGGFSAAGGAASVAFQINGYASLDGYNNCCTDVFTFSLNGNPLFSGSWNLGGGGDNVVLNSPTGAIVYTYTPGLWQGGRVDVWLPVTLASGANTIDFTYSGVDQGLNDEGWGLQNVVVSTVPEPAAWAVMLLGVGLAGAGLRAARRKAATA